jgi:NAD(P)-dependent dehydrogenase (short-subunit alcohol dehydrogenase family)
MSEAKLWFDKEDRMKEMAGKVVIVTGASRGIGRAAAKVFAAHGADLVLTSRTEQDLGDTLREVESEGQQGKIVAVDLLDETAVDRIIQMTRDHFGRIDVLVNNAGVIDNGTIENTDLEAWNRMMQLNVTVPFRLIQTALPALEATQGCVVNVSSVAGLRSFPGILAYCVSKAGIDQLTRCAALEVAGKGIRINAVNPGVVRTNLHRAGGMDKDRYDEFVEHSRTTHPIGRVGEPEEVAELIYYLASPRAGWITGVTYSIDGGRAQTCAR